MPQLGGGTCGGVGRGDRGREGCEGEGGGVRVRRFGQCGPRPLAMSKEGANELTRPGCAALAVWTSLRAGGIPAAGANSTRTA